MRDYRRSEEWKDVSPVYNSGTEEAVVPIAYSQQFKVIFGYLRAMLQQDESSERAFDLTTDAAEANPANYTVWSYRRKLLKSLNKDLALELKYASSVIEDSPKNYQVWHHRKVLVDWMEDASHELNFTDRVLMEDSKNYHAWQHRHWVVDKFALWENELEYSEKLLADDIRNNSAWNYRYFIVTSTTGFTPEATEREIQVVLAAIQRAPHNESAWNYLYGIMLHSNATGFKGKVEEFCERLYSDEKCKTNHLLAFMVDLHIGRLDKEQDSPDKDFIVNKSVALLDELVSVDPIRRNYWVQLKVMHNLTPITNEKGHVSN